MVPAILLARGIFQGLSPDSRFSARIAPNGIIIDNDSSDDNRSLHSSQQSFFTANTQLSPIFRTSPGSVERRKDTRHDATSRQTDNESESEIDRQNKMVCGKFFVSVILEKCVPQKKYKATVEQAKISFRNPNCC